MKCIFQKKSLFRVVKQRTYIAVSYRFNFLILENFIHEFILLHSIIFFPDTLLSFLILFLLVPMYFPILDMIDTLNQTRSRQQLLRVNYMVFNADDYFFYVYLQLAWGAIVIVMIVITVDSLYIIIIHHVCGLFAVCR